MNMEVVILNVISVLFRAWKTTKTVKMIVNKELVFKGLEILTWKDWHLKLSYGFNGQAL